VDIDYNSMSHKMGLLSAMGKKIVLFEKCILKLDNDSMYRVSLLPTVSGDISL
jgi:hypothetical protein